MLDVSWNTFPVIWSYLIGPNYSSAMLPECLCVKDLVTEKISNILSWTIKVAKLFLAFRESNILRIVDRIKDFEKEPSKDVLSLPLFAHQRYIPSESFL